MNRLTSPRKPTPRRAAPARDFRELRDNATQAAKLLRALSNENRLMLLCMLFEGEKTVGELNE